MHRRRFLEAAGVLGAGALAGCNRLGLRIDGGDPADAPGGYADPHAEHDWPVEPDPETAPSFDGEWPPGVGSDGMHDPKAFLRFHDVLVSRSPYVVATLEDRRVERRPDGSSTTSTVTEDVYADVDAGRYYVESSRGSERYGDDGVHYVRDVDGEAHSRADRAHVTRRAVGGTIPYFYLAFRWTDARRNDDGTFALGSDRPAGDGLPRVFREPWRGVPQDGTLSLGSDGGITGWRLASRRTDRRDGEQYTVEWTSESRVRYLEDAPDGLPSERPPWATGG